jgi:Icc-related predicted phosphoesterase
MKIQILSDIHLEFGIRKIEFGNADLIILAGDIHLGDSGIKWINENLKNIPIIYILGNHEYYKNSYPKLLNKIKGLTVNTNIIILENESTCIDGITFHGATLWTDFELFGDARIAGFECQQKMNDYNLIRRDPSYSRLRSIDTQAMHKETIYWLKNSLQASKTNKNIVISHHAPSIKSVPSRYQNDLVSAGFASNLENLILETNPDLWIHGHMHDSSDYMIGKTRVICNPKGYPGEKESGYIESLIVEI